MDCIVYTCPLQFCISILVQLAAAQEIKNDGFSPKSRRFFVI